MGARYPVLPARRQPRRPDQGGRSHPHRAESTQPVHGNIRHGFVYERVPHITLKSIANNAEIDVIWDKWQAKLEPLREQLNAALGRLAGVGDPARGRRRSGRTRRRSCTPTGGRRASPGRRRSTPPSPPRPSSSSSTTSPTRTRRRSASPGRSPSRACRPHRVLGVDENDELIDAAAGRGRPGYSAKQRLPADDPGEPQDRRRAAGAQGRQDHLHLADPWPGDLVCAEGRYIEGEGDDTRKQRKSAPHLHRPGVRHRLSAPTWSPPPARPAMPASTC
jgi:adenine-specific DNA-methyltransferase